LDNDDIHNFNLSADTNSVIKSRRAILSGDVACTLAKNTKVRITVLNVK